LLSAGKTSGTQSSQHKAYITTGSQAQAASSIILHNRAHVMMAKLEDFVFEYV